MEDRRKALVFMILSLLVGGAVSPVIKIGLQTIPPMQFAFFRFLLASLVFLPLVLQRKHIHVHQVLSLAPLSLFATSSIVFFVLGIGTTTATMGQLLYAATPFLVALFGYLLYQKRLTKKQVVGICIGFAGVMLVVLLPALEKGHPFAGDLRGNLLIFCGVIGWSLYILLSKKQHIAHSPVAITAASIFTTTIVLLFLWLLELWSHPQGVRWSGAGIGAVVYVSLLGTIGAYLMSQYIIRHGGSLFAASSYYLTPIIAYMVASQLLGEQLTLGVVVGGGLALLGVFLTTKSTQ